MQSKALVLESRAVETRGFHPRVSGTDALEAFTVAFELLNRTPWVWCLGAPLILGFLLAHPAGLAGGPVTLLALCLGISATAAVWAQRSTGGISTRRSLALLVRLWRHRAVLPGFLATSCAVLGVTAALAVYGLGILAASLPLVASAPTFLAVLRLGFPLILCAALVWIGTSWFLIVESHGLRLEARVAESA